MSRFYIETENGRTKKTLRGFDKQGLTAHIRGWNTGVAVSMSVDSEGKDIIHIYKTGGSNSSGCQELIKIIKGD